jgi:hypothetical protein
VFKCVHAKKSVSACVAIYYIYVCGSVFYKMIDDRWLVGLPSTHPLGIRGPCRNGEWMVASLQEDGHPLFWPVVV